MALVNHAKKEINAKIVYYGPAESGKSTALTYIYSRIKPSLRGELKSVPAGTDNLLFFDFSPFETTLANGYRFRLHVYTLTGPVANPATWKMTLKGTDGIVVMIDTATEHTVRSRECVSQLRDFLSAYGVGLHETPAVLQLNNRTQGKQQDNAAEIAAALDLSFLKTCCSNTTSGEGLLEALTMLSRQVLERIASTEQSEQSNQPAMAETAFPPQTSNAVAHMDAGTAPSARLSPEKPIITLLSASVDVDGTTLKIPLEIQCGEIKNRLVVTVSVAPA